MGSKKLLNKLPVPMGQYWESLIKKRINPRTGNNKGPFRAYRNRLKRARSANSPTAIPASAAQWCGSSIHLTSSGPPASDAFGEFDVSVTAFPIAANAAGDLSF